MYCSPANARGRAFRAAPHCCGRVRENAHTALSVILGRGQALLSAEGDCAAALAAYLAEHRAAMPVGAATRTLCTHTSSSHIIYIILYVSGPGPQAIATLLRMISWRASAP